MITICPYCESEYEVERKYMGHHAKCHVCGKEFVIRFSSLNSCQQNHSAAGTKFTRLCAQLLEPLMSAPWTIVFSAIYIVALGAILCVCDILLSLSESTTSFVSATIRAAVVLPILLAIQFALVRFSFVRWLLVAWGALNFVILICGSSDFACFWPFYLSCSVVAVLLVFPQTSQWYRDKTTTKVPAGEYNRRGVCIIAIVVAVIACLIINAGLKSARKRIGSSYSGYTSHSYSSSISAKEAISDALANVKSRYKGKLSRYDLTESYYDETNGICDLMLLDVQTWTKLQIVYYRSTGHIEWPRTMPKSVAEDLMQDRMIIHDYELVLGKDRKEKTPSGKRTESQSVRHKQTKVESPPLHEEYVPTPEEQAAIADSRARNTKLEKERKAANEDSPLAQDSDLRQMEELKRKGMRGDEIASRFGIDRVQEYNKVHPDNPIRTSRHSKPGAPGFTW